jgi:ABC-type thiamine transport system substrate-binding protein
MIRKCSETIMRKQRAMRAIAAALLLLPSAASAFAEESQIRVGAIDAFLMVLAGIDRPPTER